MMYTHRGVPVLGFIAASGTGKTTLLRALIPLLTGTGLRIGCIKHTHHPFEIDHPGKDSHAFRAAGASQVLLGGAQRWALIVETPVEEDPSLVQLLDRLDLARLDLVVVEGFKMDDIPKIAVHRVELGELQASARATTVIALASDQKSPPVLAIPVFDLNNPVLLAHFIAQHVTRHQTLAR